jgi:hypothetical protein
LAIISTKKKESSAKQPAYKHAAKPLPKETAMLLLLHFQFAG